MDREVLAFALWVQNHPYYKNGKSIEEMRQLWEVALNPPPDDKQWEGTYEHWSAQADQLIKIYEEA